jgi:hypothetical protein
MMKWNDAPWGPLAPLGVDVGTTEAGSVTTTPSCGRLSSQMRPPSSSTICLQMARPRPVPPCWRA